MQIATLQTFPCRIPFRQEARNTAGVRGFRGGDGGSGALSGPSADPFVFLGAFGSHELTPNLMFDIGYQGNRINNMDTMYEWNDALPGSGDRQARRPFPNLQSVLFQTANGDGWYEGLELKLMKRFAADGLSFLAGFTWSKSMDTANGFQTQAGLQNTRSRNMPLYLDKSLSEANVPKRFVLSSSYDLPFGKEKRFLQTGLGSKLLGGWSILGIFSAQDGSYFTVLLPGDRLDAGSSASQRPDLLHDPNLDPSDPNSVV
jgi:hypothetical protein